VSQSSAAAGFFGSTPSTEQPVLFGTSGSSVTVTSLALNGLPTSIKQGSQITSLESGAVIGTLQADSTTETLDASTVTKALLEQPFTGVLSANEF
jgi:hypothetical protein